MMKEKERGLLKSFFDQLNDFLVIVLLSAAAASFIISVLKGDKDFADSFLIIAIVIVNAVIGVVQESKAQKAIDDLKKLTPHKAKVVRDGEVKEIEAKDIVIGDIIVLKQEIPLALMRVSLKASVLKRKNRR
mgnify:CR=1 FL=1